MTKYVRAIPFALFLLLAACSRSTSSVGGGMAAAPAMPPGVTPALITLGDSLFNARSCQRCHGPQGVGAANAPSLTTGVWLHGGRDFANLVRIITNGLPRDSIKDATRRNPMNPRGGGQPGTQLTDDQIKAIAAYVWSISGSKTM